MVRRFLARFKLDTNFIAIVTTILSVSALAFFTVTAINAAGIPLLWTAPLAGGEAQPPPDLPADRAARRGLLVFLADEAISLQPLPGEQRAGPGACNTPSPRS